MPADENANPAENANPPGAANGGGGGAVAAAVGEAPQGAAVAAANNVVPFRTPGTPPDPQPPASAAAIRAVVQRAEKYVTAARDYYRDSAKELGAKSKRIRFWAVVLGVVGGLCPLIPGVLAGLPGGIGAASGTAATAISMFASVASSSGFLFLAIAAGLLLLDQVFGYSSAWMRFNLADAHLGGLIESFAVDVTADLGDPSDVTLPADRADTILASVRKFVADAEGIVVNETEAWIAEFKSGLLALTEATKNNRAKGVTVSNNTGPVAVVAPPDGGDGPGKKG